MKLLLPILRKLRDGVDFLRFFGEGEEGTLVKY
jgi:hypothetical protein